MNNIKSLCAIIQYDFHNEETLQLALTHSSHHRINNERMEFLGDRVLGLVIANWLVQLFPEAPEGQLAIKFNNLVNGKILAKIAKNLQIEEFYILGKTEQKKQISDTIHANILESLIAALYQDGGIETASQFIHKNWQAEIENFNLNSRPAKNILQEKCQQNGHAIPVYTDINRTGPDHDPKFFVEVSCFFGKAVGVGKNKQIAMTNAANELLANIIKNL